MRELDDHELLGEFARNGSEPAFATLVTRYVNLVHSAAFRFTDNPDHAEEITQAVFIILVRKAGKLSSKVVLSGWLYQAARLTAANFVKGEIRRQRRQQEAYMQSIAEETELLDWKAVAPLLDEAMGSLGKTDRDAVVLRYFENKSAAEVGAALQMNEETARRRVNRAVEKLRKFFTRRGVVSTGAIIAGAISANSVQAAPVALAQSVTLVAAAKSAAATGSILTLINTTMKTMLWLKIKFMAAIGASVIITVAISMAAIAQIKSPNTNEANTVAADDPLVITPGVSVGKVKAGMTEDEVIVALGKPDRQQGEVLIYDKAFGFSVVCSRQKIVGAVFCGGGVAFKGQTKEGIGVASSRDSVVKALGQPTTWAETPEEKLYYQPLGLTFTLQDGKVFHIIVDFRKPQ